MGSVSEIAASAGVRPRQVGGLDLFAADAATKTLLEACSSRGVRVLGVEGFDVSGESVTPDMSAIADLSAITDPQESVTEAMRFVLHEELADSALMFEFVLAEAGE